MQADESYFARLTGERLSEPFPDGPVSLADLAERVRDLGPRWEALAEDVDLPRREIVAPDGLKMVGAVPMAQAIHHADDHRSHVLSILGARGLPVPRLDVWAYARATGLLRDSQAGSGA